MKAETKLAMKKWALMALRGIVWHVDEWLHRREIALREELNGEKFQGGAGVKPGPTVIARKRPTATDETAQEKPRLGKARRRRGITSAAFDLRFSSR